MTVRQFVGPVFDQAEIDAMRRALARSCAVLEFGAGQRRTGAEIREYLALAILKIAEGGERDPLKLSAAALRQFPTAAVHAGSRGRKSKRRTVLASA